MPQLSLVALLFTSLAFANFDPSLKVATDIKPPDVIHWQAEAAHSFSDGTIEVGLRLQTENDFTLYTTQVSFQGPEGYTLKRANLPSTEDLVDPVSGDEVKVYRAGEFILHFQGFEPYKSDTFRLTVKYLGCTKQICLFPYTQVLELSNYYTDTPNPGEEHPHIEATQDLSLEEQLTKNLEKEDLSKWLFFLFVFLGGILTNLTPCVYPMIPITIRLLANQGKHPFQASLTYGFGIMLTYSSLGILAAMTGSMFGGFMATPLVATFFSLVMFVLALTMLGYGNFNTLQNLGYKIGAKKSGLANALLMGIGAGFIASPCTGPILASLLALSSSANSIEASLLMVTYSLGFAIPYVFLGTASAKIAKIKISGLGQTIVKTFFAACMFALSLYYLRIVGHSLIKGIEATNWLWTSALLLAASILVFFTFTRKKHTQKEWLILPALFLGISFFCAYSGFTKQSSRKAMTELAWLFDEKMAYTKAKLKNKPLLIDAWAEWCEACKKMDAQTFSDNQIVSLLQDKGWVLLKLDLTETSLENDKLQEKYKISGLPTLLYVPVSELEQQNPKFETLFGFTSAASLSTFIKEH